MESNANPDHCPATVVLTAGGTGGHIFPAEALAESLVMRGIRVVLITDKRFANFSTGIFSRTEVCTVIAGAPSLSLKGLWRAFKLLAGIGQAASHLKKLQPAAVVGFGGYPSFPAMIAARILGIPSILHEQNAILGRANRVLAKTVVKLATSFPETRNTGRKAAAKVVYVGNPVRAAVRSLYNEPYPHLDGSDPMKILVLGGSQGASIFSQVVPAAIASLPSALRSRIYIMQQCRREDLDVTRDAYKQLGVTADLASFFSDVPARLKQAHLVISRAGASSITECAVAGRPSILVPLPTAMDNHQAANASALEKAGGTIVIPQLQFTAAALAERIESFASVPASLTRMSDNARKVSVPDAAEKLMALVLQICGAKESSRPFDPSNMKEAA